MDELHGLRGLPKVAALASKLVDLVMDQVAADRCLNRENIRNAMMGPLVIFELEAEAAIRRAAKPAEAPKVEPLEFEQLLVNRINSAQAAVDRAAAERPKVVPAIMGWDVGRAPDTTLVWKNRTADEMSCKPGSLSQFAVDHSGIWMKGGRGVWTDDIPESAVLPNMDTPIWKWTPCSRRTRRTGWSARPSAICAAPSRGSTSCRARSSP